MRPEREALLIGKRPGRTVGQVPNRDHCRDLAAKRHSLRRGSEELIERSTLVRLDVRERDEPKRRHRDDALDGLAHCCEQPAWTGVEQKRLGIANQVLIEGKSTWNNARRNGSADSEDAVGDLVDTGGGSLGVHDFPFRGWDRVKRGTRSARQSPAMRAASGLERLRVSSCQAG